MAADRYTVTLESKTIGLEDVTRLENTINRVFDQASKARAAADSVATATGKAGQSSAQFAAQFNQFVRDPLGSASTAAESFLTKLGPMGIGLGAVGAAAIAGGTALLSFIKSTGDAAETIQNLSITTGLSVREVQQFGGALGLSGAKIEDLEKAAIKLNQQLADTGTAGQSARKALAGIGVSIFDTSGKLKEAGPLLLDLSKGLASIGDRAERDRLGVDLLGKSYRSLIPAFTELNGNVQAFRSLGLGIDDATLSRADALADKLSLVEAKFGQLIFRAKAFAASLADPVLDALLRPGPATASGAVGAGTALFGPAGGALAGRLLGGEFPGSDKSVPRIFGPDPTVASILSSGLAGNGTIESQRQQLSDLRNQIDSARLKISQLANTPGLTEEAATREVNALRALEGQYKRLQGQIEAAEKAKRDFDKLNALGTFTLTDQYYAIRSRQQLASSPLLAGGPLAFLNEGSFGVTGVSIPGNPTPSLRRGAERDFPPGLGTFQISEADIAAANAGASGALATQNRAFGAGLIAADQQSRQDRVDDIRQELAFQSERLRLIIGPGGELAAIREIAKLRLEGVERELAITGDLRKADGERLQIARDRQLEELRFARERDDRNRQTGGQVFDALLAGGAGARSFVSGLGLGTGRTAFSNVFAEIARGTTGLLQLPGQTRADGTPNLFGRVLTGTPFGLDPQRVAIDRNTLATEQNTVALLGARSGSVAGGQAGSILSGVPSLFGAGSGSNPFIFSATGGSGRNIPLIYGDGSVYGSTTGGLSTAGKIASVAGAVGGGLLVKSGIEQGGLRGALDIGSGGGSAFAALAPLIGLSGPAAPIAAAVAVGLQVVKSLLPDPRERRSRAIDQLVNSSRFDPGTIAAIDEDFATGGTVASNKGGVIVIQHINAADAKSFMDQRNHIADALGAAIAEGHSASKEIQRAVELGV